MGIGAQLPTLVPVRDGEDSQINRGGEPLVQAQLFMEEISPLGEGRIIEEGKAYRFFDFVDQIPGKKEMGDMGLDMGYLRRPLGVKRGLQHGFYKGPFRKGKRWSKIAYLYCIM
jgi:hypothetical protein